MRMGVAGVWLAGVGAASAQDAGAPAGAVLTYERDWPVQVVPYYKFRVHADGSGVFTTSRAALPPGGSPAGTGVDGGGGADAALAGAGGTAGEISEIHLSAKTVARVFGVAGAMHSGKGCQEGSKHLAQTGRKTLVLDGDGPAVSCTFNYSDDKRVEDAAAAFGAMATTLEERPVLEHLRRFDRLGLDAELGSFLEAAQAGRAIELANIQPLLAKLAGDEALMDRVRSRAATLLTMAQAGS